MRTSLTIGALALACVGGVSACGRSHTERSKSEFHAPAASAPVGQSRVVATPATVPPITSGTTPTDVVKAAWDAKRSVVLGDGRGGFGLNDIWLSRDGRKKIDEFVLGVIPQIKTARIEIEGHTDGLGSKTANDRVALARAEAVKKYLCDRYGVAEDHITIVNVGADRPVGDNTTDEGRALNRRVVITLLDND